MALLVVSVGAAPFDGMAFRPAESDGRDRKFPWSRRRNAQIDGATAAATEEIAYFGPSSILINGHHLPQSTGVATCARRRRDLRPTVAILARPGVAR